MSQVICTGKAAGVDQDELGIVPLRFTEVPVTGQTRGIRHQGVPGMRHAVEKSGFPHVWAPDNGDNRFHFVQADSDPIVVNGGAIVLCRNYTVNAEFG